MLIDWFTVAAQIVNFAVLVALLKRFLWGPLVKAIDAREQTIAAQVAEAARCRDEAAVRIGELARQAAETEREKSAILASAREEADRARGEILNRARADVRETETRWRSELEREKAAFLDEVRRRAADEILAAARGALRDLACLDVETAALSAFLQRIDAMDPALLRKFAAEGMAVVTHDEISAEMRARVQSALAKRLGGEAEIRFETAPAMAWGLELHGNGQRIGWTPDAWLDTVEDKLRTELDRSAQAASVVSVVREEKNPQAEAAVVAVNESVAA